MGAGQSRATLVSRVETAVRELEVHPPNLSELSYDSLLLLDTCLDPDGSVKDTRTFLHYLEAHHQLEQIRLKARKGEDYKAYIASLASGDFGAGAESDARTSRMATLASRQGQQHSNSRTWQDNGDHSQQRSTPEQKPSVHQERANEVALLRPPARPVMPIDAPHDHDHHIGHTAWHASDF
ncbi:unnamed protein product [Vitrella brassicaformis CCMP3155]|uniref:Uncharacterized protein n=1 Tax=Vitrella brassicaformis (strain CCMP3155) TaxID=1169540 RepID=A0A0G4H1X3_VITBC|nr:unnamed protein product [Vitrella brassicaformis CCMP3155]|eukprot:CEM37402.1 unnamed protein product [Vitrella brassicaformis CCMP3155]